MASLIDVSGQIDGHDLRSGAASGLRPGMSGGSALCLLWLFLGTVYFVVSLFHSDYRVAVYGCLACVIVTLPAVSHRYSFTSVWTMILVSVYIGCGIRTLAIVTRGLDDPLVNRAYLLGHGLQLVDRWVPLYLLGLAILTASFMGLSQRKADTSFGLLRERKYEFSTHAWWAISAFALIGTYGFLSYVNVTAGFDGSVISAKRAIYTPGRSYEGSFGMQRAIGQFGSVALILAVAAWATGKPAKGFHLLTRAIVAALLFINAVALPVYSSTRAEVLNTLIGAIVVFALIRGRFPRRVLAVLGASGLILVGLMTISRQRAQGIELQVEPESFLSSVRDAFILNRNFTEIFKSVNVMDAVPRILDYSNGLTVFRYLVAPVPRSVWPDKPLIDSGVEVGIQIYGTGGSSVPPGLIGEAYWAFGMAGVVVVCLVSGWLLRRVGDRAVRWAKTDASVAAVYGGALFNIGGSAIGGSMGNALFAGTILFLLITLGLAIAGRWERCGHA